MSTQHLENTRHARDTLRRRIESGITITDDGIALDAICASEYRDGHARGVTFGRLGFMHAQTAALYTLAAFVTGFASATGIALLTQ